MECERQMDLPALFTTFPSLHEVIPWHSLMEGPTPVQEMHQLRDAYNYKGALWAKLDNLTSKHYGGNKVRKLEFIIGDAIKGQKVRIATMGGLGTNHGLATTIHGRQVGLKTRLYLHASPISPLTLRNLKLLHHFGAALVLVKSKWNLRLRFYGIDRLRFPRTYWLITGGSTPLGALGYVNAALELYQQVQKGLLPEPELIFIPVGSLGTIAGLELGLQIAGMKTRIRGISVGISSSDSSDRIMKLINQSLALLKVTPELRHLRIKPRYEIVDAFAGKAYGVPTKLGLEAISAAAKYENLILEPTYTGKTFAAFLHHLQHSSAKEVVLFWNTYNSVDLTSIANAIDYQDLPSEFHKFFI